MRQLATFALVFVLAAGLSACGEEDTAPPPAPNTLTQEYIGYYCNMTVADHTGPKGQVWLKSKEQPLWFSSVRDTITFTLLDEEPKDLLVIYVTDMTKPDSWDSPAVNDWIDINSAHFVIGSSKRGGMGAPEPVPFATRETAEMFTHQYGGKVVSLSHFTSMADLGPMDVEGMDHGTDKKGNDG